MTPIEKRIFGQMYKMCRLLLFFLLWTCSNYVGGQRETEWEGERDAGPLENFIEAIIGTWKPLSPTIIIREELTDLCRRRDMMLCVTNDANVTELAEHLARIHQMGRQDGLIFVGSTEHELLLNESTKIVPSLFTSNCPVFMPKEYSTMIKLRLDSNIIFYEKSTEIEYDLLDIFAVKGGAPISVEFGKWDEDSGMRLFSSMSRWGRRTDLNGAEFVNALHSWTPDASELIKDHDGNIVGSRGYQQEQLFYMTDKLNLTIRTIEVDLSIYDIPYSENGSWTGVAGLFQQKQIDVFSASFGVTLKECIELPLFDCPFAILENEATLIAASTTGTAPNMWVYVHVFGVVQWTIFLILLMLMVMALSLINNFTKQRSVKTFGTKRGGSREPYQLSSIASGFALVFLYSIQMGSHPTTKNNAMRVLTLVISMLTLLTFLYYTTDITSNMTAGPPNHPVKNFEDVLYHGYSVIVLGSHFRDLLAKAPTDSAKHKVYKNLDMTYCMNCNQDAANANLAKVAEAFKKVATEEKILLYGYPNDIIVKEAKPYDLKYLDLDDSAVTKVYATMPLQKDSEFLQVFNYYIQKANEHGIYKRLWEYSELGLFANEHFGMQEPQPLGANNVMFIFILLCFAACFSLFIGLAEKCYVKIMSPSTSTNVAERRIQESGMVTGPSQPPKNIPDNPGSPDINSQPHKDTKVRVKGNRRRNTTGSMLA